MRKAGPWSPTPRSLDTWWGRGTIGKKRSRKIKGKGVCHCAKPRGAGGLETWKVLNLDVSVKEPRTQV